MERLLNFILNLEERFDKNKVPTFQGEELEAVTKEEETSLIELLKLDLA